MNLTKDEVLKLAKEYKLVEYLNLECTEKSISWIFEEDELLAFSNAIADLQRDRVCSEFSPRNWSSEMSAAWHRNIPDVQAAFDALIAAIRANKE